MSDYLERLEARFAEYRFPLFTDDEYNDLRAVLADAQQLRAQGTEFGIRADWISTRSSEGPVAETLGDALAALDEFDAKHGGRVVSRELVERSVGEWRKVGGER